MDAAVKAALESDKTVDITTTGRRSGRSVRIETWFYRSRGRYFLSGSPGKRDWQANLIAIPRMKFHLKEIHDQVPGCHCGSDQRGSREKKDHLRIRQSFGKGRKRFWGQISMHGSKAVR